MKRLFLALVPWMALTGSANAQAVSADVLFTHHDEIPQRAFRVGDECFVPVDQVTSWGWQVETHGNRVGVRAETKDFEFATRFIGGLPTIPLRKIIGDLGGEANWIWGTDTLSVLAPLSEVAVADGKLKVSSPLSLHARAFYLADPNRLIIDFTGAKLTAKTKQTLPDGTRVLQFNPRTVRVVIETPYVPQVPDKRNVDGRDVELAIQQDTNVPPPVVVTVPPPVTTDSLSLTVGGSGRDYLNLVAHVPNEMSGLSTYRMPDPTTLEVVIPSPNLGLPPDSKPKSDIVESVNTYQEAANTVLAFKFTRPVGSEVSPSGRDISIRLIVPDVGNGRLAGKTIIVDPGHGGHDSGAKYGPVLEKDLNLTIGRLIARRLAAAGATVIMTRSDDTFIPLPERSNIATRNKADLFISNHINATGGSGNQSGTITFYHGGKPVCKVLAECVQKELVKVNGLPNLGVWSDKRIYDSGFSVLRGATMPAVLLELGFIGNDRDRKRMVTADFQESVAGAVVRGVRLFLGDKN